jgi:hypothetical protein
MAEALPDIRGFLLGDPTVSGMVNHGSPAIPSVFPVILKEVAPLPALTYHVVDMPSEGIDIDDIKSVGVKYMRLQIDCWGMTYPDCDALAWAVRARFDGFAGVMGTVPVVVTSRDNGFDDYESDRKQYRRVLDFILACYDT